MIARAGSLAVLTPNRTEALGNEPATMMMNGQPPTQPAVVAPEVISHVGRGGIDATCTQTDPRTCDVSEKGLGARKGRRGRTSL